MPDAAARKLLTQEEADAIFRATPWFAFLDDAGEEDERGFLYYLEDGSMILVGHDLTIIHGD